MFQIPKGRIRTLSSRSFHILDSSSFKSQREELELISVFIAFIHNLSFKSQREELEHDIQVKYFNSIAKFQIPTEKVKTLTPKIYTLLGLHVSNPKGKSQNAVVLAIAFGRNVGFKSQWEKVKTRSSLAFRISSAGFKSQWENQNPYPPRKIS